MSSNYLPNNEFEAKEYSLRYRLVYGLIIFTLVTFGARLWYLQIINGSELRVFSEQNSIKESKIQAPRGIVYDRNGQILVENLPGFEATISPQYVGNLEDTASLVGPALKMAPSTVVQMVQKSRRMNGPFRPVRIKDNLTREEIFALELLKLDYSGIDIKEAVLRSYPLKQNGAQLFGYVGEISKMQLPRLNDKYKGVYKFQQGDIIGKSGLEEVLDGFLRGRDGISVMQVDARGREAQGDTPSLLGNMNGIQDAVPGRNVILTIDRDIQEAAFNAFNNQGRIGGAVVMKTNGEVLAWVNSPSFDPNEFSTGISVEAWSKLINDPDKPLRNKIIQEHNSPGSTFKPIIALAALSEKVVTPTTIVSCPGQIKYKGRAYHDTLKQGHGNLMITQAIEQSANIFFYKMGMALGIEKMFKYCDAVGIGRKSGIDLFGEEPGLMPNEAWKKEALGEEWQLGENLSVAIGQGFVLTHPLQMAIAYNAIGTEGQVVKPFIVKKILTPDNKIEREFEPTLIRDLSKPRDTDGFFIRKEVFKTVKEGMRLVINGDRGTARLSRLPFIEIAGKTGTSQVMGFKADQLYINCESRPRAQRHHGWFIGYAPADNPEIAFGILAEHSCHGASGAAPVAKEIVRAWTAKYHPQWLGRNVHVKNKAGSSEGPIVPAVAPAPEPVVGPESESD